VSREFGVEHPEWSPDGDSLVVNGHDWADDVGTIYRVDLDAPDAPPMVVLSPAAGKGWGGVKPVYSPDGAHTVFVCFQQGVEGEGICTMGADGAGVAQLVDEPGVSENHPAWGVSTP
jgi:Tol biopolymer transport system component